MTNKEFAKQIFDEFERFRTDYPLLNSKVKSVGFKMFSGVYKKAFLPPKILPEGSYKGGASRIIFELENGYKFEQPLYVDTLFLKFTPKRFGNTYSYTIICEEPSKFHIELKKELELIINK